MYRYLDHTADLLIEACGDDYASALEELARGMTDAMVDIQSINPQIEFKIDIHGMDMENLVQSTLSEILYLFDTEKLVFSDFKFELDMENYHLTGICRGEQYHQERHGMKLEIKAVTYHMMEITSRGEKKCIKVLFDI